MELELSMLYYYIFSYNGYDDGINIEKIFYCFIVVWCVIVKVKNKLGISYDIKENYVNY